jgi:tetratricopeptide (TPR) repeat protein
VIPARKHLDYAQGFIELGLFAEARDELAWLSPAERIHADAIPVRLELAMGEEDWVEVPLLAHEATRLDPTQERPWVAWAYALREQHYIAEAREVLLRGESQIHDPSPIVSYNLSCYYCLLGDLPEAMRRLKKVFARDPEWKNEAAKDPDLAGLRSG